MHMCTAHVYTKWIRNIKNLLQRKVRLRVCSTQKFHGCTSTRCTHASYVSDLL